MSIQSLRTISHALMWVSIILPFLGAVAAGARFYVDRYERQLSSTATQQQLDKVQVSAAVARGQLDSVKKELAERTDELGKIQRQIAIIRTVELQISLSAVKLPHVANAVVYQLPVRKRIALIAIGVAPIQLGCADGVNIADSADRWRVFRAVYRPTDPGQVGGHPIDELTKVSTLALDFAEIMEVANLEPDKPAHFVALLSVNGVVVASFKQQLLPRFLAAGERHLDVSHTFQQVRAEYDAYGARSRGVRSELQR